MANGAHTWTCTACGRRVPLRVSTCHCGRTRERVEAEAAARLEAEARAERIVASRPRPGADIPPVRVGPLPRDVKLMLGGLAVVAVAAVGWLILGPRPDPVVPVLGLVETGPPPTAKPTPPPQPPFKLPWWK